MDRAGTGLGRAQNVAEVPIEILDVGSPSIVNAFFLNPRMGMTRS